MPYTNKHSDMHSTTHFDYDKVKIHISKKIFLFVCKNAKYA